MPALILVVGLGGMTATATALAAVATSPDPTTGLLNYGLAGLLGVMLVTLFYRWLTREQTRADAAEAEVKRLNELLLTTTSGAVDAMRSNVSAVEENTRLLGEVRTVLDEGWTPPPRRPPARRRTT